MHYIIGLFEQGKFQAENFQEIYFLKEFEPSRAKQHIFLAVFEPSSKYFEHFSSTFEHFRAVK